MSKIEDVARGLLVDAFITYAAICREKGYIGEVPASIWDSCLGEMSQRIDLSNVAESHESSIDTFVRGHEPYDEHVEALIEERRGLIRDTMREEMDDLEAASPPAEDAEGIRDERQG